MVHGLYDVVLAPRWPMGASTLSVLHLLVSGAPVHPESRPSAAARGHVVELQYEKALVETFLGHEAQGRAALPGGGHVLRVHTHVDRPAVAVLANQAKSLCLFAALIRDVAVRRVSRLPKPPM